MPTYLYRCKSCSYEFEELQKITEDPLRTCPSCSKDTLIRVLSGGAGLLFKGSGFYETDYKKAGAKETKRPSSGQKPASDQKSDQPSSGKGDAKQKESGSSKPAGDSAGS
jgi:putative FmdB family regulatory protein